MFAFELFSAIGIIYTIIVVDASYSSGSLHSWSGCGRKTVCATGFVVQVGLILLALGLTSVGGYGWRYSGTWNLIDGLWVCLVAPALEELSFRFVLLRGLAALLGSDSVAVTVSALLFAMAHSGRPVAVGASFAFGVVAGALCVTGRLSLCRSFQIHATYNTAYFLWKSVYAL